MSTYRGANIEARLPCPNILRCQEIPDRHLGGNRNIRDGQPEALPRPPKWTGSTTIEKKNDSKFHILGPCLYALFLSTLTSHVAALYSDNIIGSHRVEWGRSIIHFFLYPTVVGLLSVSGPLS